MPGETAGVGVGRQGSATATDRPVGVTLLAILDFLFAAGFLFLALLLFTAGGLAGVLGEGSGAGALLGALGAVGGVFFLALAGLTAAIGWGLLTGKKWAWGIEVGFEVLTGLFGLVALFAGDLTQIVWLGLTGLILWYLFRPYVKAYFGM